MAKPGGHQLASANLLTPKWLAVINDKNMGPHRMPKSSQQVYNAIKSAARSNAFSIGLDSCLKKPVINHPLRRAYLQELDAIEERWHQKLHEMCWEIAAM